MKRISFLLVLVMLLASACTRPRGTTTACFNLSKTPGKVNDTLYLLNCSVNYDKFRWFIPAYLYIDTSNRHLKFVPASPGNLDIYLWVALNDTTTSSSVMKTVSIQ